MTGRLPRQVDAGAGRLPPGAHGHRQARALRADGQSEPEAATVRAAGEAVPVAGLWARIVQRLLALNACIWLNWQAGAPVKCSLIAYGHA